MRGGDGGGALVVYSCLVVVVLCRSRIMVLVSVLGCWNGSKRWWCRIRQVTAVECTDHWFWSSFSCLMLKLISLGSLFLCQLTMGGVLGKDESTKVSTPETKLEAKILEAVRKREAQGTSMKSFESLVLKFPKIDESLRKCKASFEEFDEDKNGAIDPQELKHCFHKLEINFSDEEINDLFEACDINEDMGIKLNEFIVLLCLVYLLEDNPAAVHTKSRVGMPNLEATFETLVDAFAFLDKNKDGYVSKKEMVEAINGTTGERSSGRIAMKRFEEMDWDKNGMVNFKEFLFAFTRWVGIDEEN